MDSHMAEWRGDVGCDHLDGIRMSQRPGNHGRIIPRDPELLRRLYWDENKTTVEMAAMFNVRHRSIINVMKALNIPRRPIGKSRHHHCMEQNCHEPIYKILHRTNGSAYGRFCYQHFKLFRKKVCARWWQASEKDSNYKKGFQCPRCGGPKSDFSAHPESICRACFEYCARQKRKTVAEKHAALQIRREEQKCLKEARRTFLDLRELVVSRQRS